MSVWTEILIPGFSAAVRGITAGKSPIRLYPLPIAIDIPAALRGEAGTTIDLQTKDILLISG
jgi:hypothetical protein